MLSRSAQQSFDLTCKIFMLTMLSHILMPPSRQCETNADNLYFILSMSLVIGGADLFVRVSARNRFGLFDVLRRPNAMTLVMNELPPQMPTVSHV